MDVAVEGALHFWEGWLGRLSELGFPVAALGLPPTPSNNGAFAYWEWSGEEPVDSV